MPVAIRRMLAHESGRWIVLAGSVGVICGLAGFVLQAGADVLGLVLLQRVCGFPQLIAAAHAPAFIGEANPIRWPLVLVVLMIGGAVAGWLAARFSMEAKGGGTSQAISAYHQLRAAIPISVPLTKIAASIATLGTGGSAGCEGPIALVGAGCGSVFAQRLRLSTRDRRILLIAGIAGGIAAVFRAPLAASLFACEVLYLSADLEAEALIPAFISAVIAYCVSGQLDDAWCSATGWFTPYGSTLFNPPAALGFGIADWPQLIGYGLLALAVVITARMMIAANARVDRAVAAWRKPVWVTAAFGATVAGGLALALVGIGRLVAPAGVDAILPATLGSGYGAIHWCLHGGMDGAPWQISVALLAIAAVKVMTTAFTVSSGGSGGLFGPSIAIGGCVGAALGTAMAGMAIAPPPAAALLLGMAGLLAATHRTPVAAVLMVAEISGSYLLLIPSMWVVGLCFLLMRGRSVLHGQVEHLHDSPAHRGHLLTDLFDQTSVGDLLHQAPAWEAVPEHATLGRCRQVLLGSDQMVLPVVDADGRIAGIITQEEIRGVGNDPLLDHLMLASDIASGAALVLRPQDPLARAMRRMTDQRLDGLPVVDDAHRPLAILTRRMLLDHYQRSVEGLRAEQQPDGVQPLDGSRRSSTVA